MEDGRRIMGRVKEKRGEEGMGEGKRIRQKEIKREMGERGGEKRS